MGKKLKKIKRLLPLLIVLLLIPTWYRQEVMIRSARAKIEVQQAEYNRTEKEHERLSGILSGAETNEFVLRSARIRLDMIQPGEIPVRQKAGE